MTLTSKKCLVTGGAGFIGSHLVDELLSQGAIVRVYDNLMTGKLANISQHFGKPKFTFFEGSVLDRDFMNHVTKDIDLTFHLACLGVRHSLKDPLVNQQVNAQGTFNALEASKNNRVKKFIYCSTSEIYGTAINVPMDEEHPTKPSTIYGASKLAGESYTRAFYLTYELPIVIIRPFNTYGPRSHHEGDAGEVIPKNILRALNGRELVIYGDGSITRDFTYVKDTVRAFLLAAKDERLIGKTFNIGSNKEISIIDLLMLINKMAGSSHCKIKHTEQRSGEVLRLLADSTRFTTATGWKPEVDLEHGLRQTIDYFKYHPSGLEKLLGEEIEINWR